jgi:hypothetical protein
MIARLKCYITRVFGRCDCYCRNCCKYFNAIRDKAHER